MFETDYATEKIARIERLYLEKPHDFFGTITSLIEDQKPVSFHSTERMGN